MGSGATWPVELEVGTSRELVCSLMASIGAIMISGCKMKFGGFQGRMNGSRPDVADAEEEEWRAIKTGGSEDVGRSFAGLKQVNQEWRVPVYYCNRARIPPAVVVTFIRIRAHPLAALLTFNSPSAPSQHPVARAPRPTPLNPHRIPHVVVPWSRQLLPAVLAKRLLCGRRCPKARMGSHSPCRRAVPVPPSVQGQRRPHFLDLPSFALLLLSHRSPLHTCF